MKTSTVYVHAVIYTATYVPIYLPHIYIAHNYVLTVFFFHEKMNTFQGIIVTDGVNSYSVFTYKCGEMEWSRGGVIGFNAGGEPYRNHPLSQLQDSSGAPLIACSNSAISQWTNVVIKLSIANATGTDAPPTVEPRTYVGQDQICVYLLFVH